MESRGQMRLADVVRVGVQLIARGNIHEFRARGAPLHVLLLFALVRGTFFLRQIFPLLSTQGRKEIEQPTAFLFFERKNDSQCGHLALGIAHCTPFLASRDSLLFRRAADCGRKKQESGKGSMRAAGRVVRDEGSCARRVPLDAATRTYCLWLRCSGKSKRRSCVAGWRK